LSTPFAEFVMLGENAIHGADRAQIDALVEQAGVDFGWSKIDKPRGARIGGGRRRTGASGCLRKAWRR